MEERGLSLAFHSGPNWQEPVFRACNRFISVHALGFSFYNIVHCTNWVINGLCERFPKLPVIWIEAGLAWIPFLMQRLDNEYMMRPSEAPLLKKKPSEYMREMYYSTQPIEIQDRKAHGGDLPHDERGEPSCSTRRTIRTGTSTCPAPSTTCRSFPREAKHNILGGTAARLFKLPPRNDKQKQNLIRFGNLAA